MNPVTSIILRQMRAPLIVIVTVFSIAILGMVLIPGVDDQGQVWRMDFFHALYFVSFTATTIGFGEIPYPLTDAQRLWALITIFFSVFGWFYAISKIVSLIQTPLFKKAVIHSNFKHSLSQINKKFYLICGYGETGQDLVNRLVKKAINCVVIDNNQHAIEELEVQDYIFYVPGLEADATTPSQLEYAGLSHPLCKGVIAITNSDSCNLKIAITAKLLHPETPVICRSEHTDFEENMRSFNTDHTVNPYDTFAHNFAMAMKSSSLHLLNEWLTGVPDTSLDRPITFSEGHWILCGYGRLGQRIYKTLRENHHSVTIIDTVAELRDEFYRNNPGDDTQFIIGTGTDVATLKQAGVVDAVGLIAGSNNDSNNLSAIMTAQMYNADLVVVARQNEMMNKQLFQASLADIIMHPSEIVARRIRTLLTNPLLIDFLEECYKQSNEWINITISRLSGAISEVKPHCWTSRLTKTGSPAVFEALSKGRKIALKHLLKSPIQRQEMIYCLPLMLVRNNQKFLLPNNDFAVHADDQILFCGISQAEHHISQCLHDMHTLNYVMSLKNSPDSLLGRYLRGNTKQKRRNND
ncbi:MAG: potassium channel family protein [Gammaproteobacteria bacterium]|nr:potassium channel family protein [Gammaproteobacteria bacterium]